MLLGPGAISKSKPRGFESAVVTVTPIQRLFLVLGFCSLIFLAISYRSSFFLYINALIVTFYMISTIYRLWLVDISMRSDREIEVSKEQIRAKTGAWPNYLVLVPLYREKAILPTLVESLRKLDYPVENMEIRLLIEEDDNETRETALSLNLEAPFVIYNIPDSLPKTKPKACNVALENSNADIVVIFDAEDQPEPDQLKKVALAFEQVGPDVACIQAKLNFFNSNRNLLTRWFTAEYATWFELCLPALDYLQAPIPLGGTSNHFRMSTLRTLGGWDEYNVTEDCDLGLRIYACGHKTRIVNSTTWEQACPNVFQWIRQRSRWVKGYIQTYLVHLRRPFAMWRSHGFFGSLHFHVLVGGSAFCQLINPIYWLMALLWFLVKMEAIDQFFPAPVFVMATFCLFVGNFSLAYSGAIACVRRGVGNLAVYAIFMPFYWAVMSLAAWKGFLQLFFKPHFWEKTTHYSEVPEVEIAID